MSNEEWTLLCKAAADPKGQIAVKRAPNGAWPGDRNRIEALAEQGHMSPVGESMGPHIGGTFAVWRITAKGRALVEQSVEG